MPQDENAQFKGYGSATKIGGGGFSDVYTVTQSSIGREVVIKVIRPDRANQPDFIRRFETEAQIVARLEHPHITPLIDFWRDPQGAYLVMRYLRGGSIDDCIKKQGAIDPSTTSRMLEQIAAALDFAHRNAVIHRDIKPGNLLLDEDGNAYVADFGIAKDLSSVDPDSQTNPEHIIGSLDYIAPEQARGEPVTPRTDIYSLGVTLYEMLTGKHPFENDNPVQRLYKHMTDPLPDLQGLPDDVQDALNDIIQKATAKDPAKRYPDVIALAVAFREAVQARPVEGLTPREIDILLLLAERKSNQEIAQELFLSYETVRFHLRNIYKKLGVPNRSQAVKRARELGWLGGDEVGDFPSLLTGEFSLVEPDNPYKGLRSFNIEDARDFFGREKAVEKLLQRMTEGSRFERFLAIVGPSGSGKSSLVKAGLHPALLYGALPGLDKWFYVSMKPQNHPLDELEIALTKLAANQGQNMRQHLERDERGLVRAAELLLPDDGSELFIIIDQFEEVFTLVENEKERQHFLNLLLSAASDARSRVRLVVTLRADYYDKPLHYPEFGEMLRTRMETILPLTATGLEHAIVRPAQRVGVNFEPGLVAQIVSEINYQAGALPLLQYALTELFEHRQGRLLTLEAYQRIGGVVGALAKGADTIYNGFDSTAQQLTKQIFLRLVTLGEGAEDTRRRATLDELLSIAPPPSLPHRNGGGVAPATEGVHNDLLNEILESFTQSRLLTLGHDDGTRQPTIEVAHEAILREWATLREWLNDNREDIRQERIIAQAADAWQSNQRDNSYLLSGTRLEQVEKWDNATELALTPLERDFIAASIAARTMLQKAEAERQARETRLEQRSRNFLRGLVAVLMLATLGAFALTSIALNNANAAETARMMSDDNFHRSEALRLASAANVLLPGNVSNAELAALLTIRSLSSTYSPEGDAALVQASQLLYTQQIFTTPQDAFMIDARYLADGLTLITVLEDNSLRLTNTVTGEERTGFIDFGEGLRTINVSPNEQFLLTIKYPPNDTVRLWNLTTGELQHTLATGFGRVNNAAFSPDEQILATAGDGKIQLWNLATETQIALLSPAINMPLPRVDGIEFSHDGRFLLAGLPGMIIMYDIETQAVIQRFEGHASFVFDMAFSPDDTRMVSVSADGTARLWNVETGDEIHRLSGHTARIPKVAFSPDGNYVLTASDDGTARMWDVATGEEVRRFSGHEGNVFNGSLQFSPDGNQMLTTRADGTVRLWDTRLDVEPHQLVANNTQFDALAVSPDGQWAFAASDGKALMWNMATLELTDGFEVPPDTGVADAVFSPDSRYLLMATNSGAELWETATRQSIRHFNDTKTMSVTFSPDGQKILIGGDDGSIGLWDVATGQLLQQFEPLVGTRVWQVSFSADGHILLANGSDSGELRLWDAATGQHFTSLTNQVGSVSSAVFSSHGNLLATGNFNGVVQIWDLNTGEVMRTLETGTSLQIFDLTFSPSNHWVVASSYDGTVWMWDVTTGQNVRHFAGHSAPVKRVRFSVDEKWVLTSSLDGTIRSWHQDYHDLIAATCTRIFQDFNAQDRVQYHITDSEPTCPQFATSTDD